MNLNFAIILLSNRASNHDTRKLIKTYTIFQSRKSFNFFLQQKKLTLLLIHKWVGQLATFSLFSTLLCSEFVYLWVTRSSLSLVLVERVNTTDFYISMIIKFRRPDSRHDYFSEPCTTKRKRKSAKWISTKLADYHTITHCSSGNLCWSRHTFSRNKCKLKRTKKKELLT